MTPVITIHYIFLCWKHGRNAPLYHRKEEKIPEFYSWSPRPDLNRRPRPYQGRALPLSYPGQPTRKETLFYLRVSSFFTAKEPFYIGHLFPNSELTMERETGFEPATLSLEG